MAHNRASLPGEIDSFSSSSENSPARLQRRSYLIALALALLGLGISLVNIFRAPQQERKYSLNELTYSQVILDFDNGAPEIIVSHPFGIDTLRKDADYILLRDRITSRIGETGITAVASKDEALDEIWENPLSSQEDKLPVLRLDIAGEREAGSVLDFTIENYDPNVFYYIDFGDGYRRKVDKESVFTYSKPGTFTLNLYASISEKGLYSSYTKKIRVHPSVKKYSPETDREKGTRIADLFPPQDDENLIQKPTFDASTNNLLSESEKSNAESDTNLVEDDGVLISDLGVLKENINASPTGDKDVIKLDPKPIIETSLDENNAINKPFYDAEMMPEFPGGVKAMARYLKKNAIYPQKASQSNIEGTVNVRLVVQADGSLSDLKVLSGLGYGCDDEALRLVSRMPRWIPGVKNGIYVPVYTVIPITFRLIH